MMMNQFHTVVGGYIGAGILALFAQIPDVSAFSSWIQYGALGLLGITVLGQLYIIVITLRDMFARMDKWEESRHDDSNAMNETLARLRENCASRGKDR